jgi:hypothetical protein
MPLGWALDKRGNPATAPKAGLEGSILPAGGVKSALALMVELLLTAHRRTDRLRGQLLLCRWINPGSAGVFGHRSGAAAR